MAEPVDNDSTIVLKRPVPPPEPTRPEPSRRLPPWAIVLPALLGAIVVTGGWFLWTPHSSPPAAIVSPEPRTDVALRSLKPAQPADAPSAPDQPRTATDQAVPAVAVPAPATEPAVERPPADAAQAIQAAIRPSIPGDFRIETATEQRMLDHAAGDAEGFKVFRFKLNPRILVLDFTSLRDQGRMLNRAAALVEKHGLPHDRLLSDAELDTAVRASGDTVETFYYGHDYGASSLVRFFNLAERDNVGLSAEEAALANLLRQEGWFDPNTRAGLISIPRVGADEHVTRRARATILHHELSHGEYFTNPAYAAFVHKFWRQTLTEAERQQVRDHLRSLGYDSALDDLMENEAQAYLMFTDGAEFFSPDMFGMTKGRVNDLRTGFYRAMPGGWLRDSLGQSLGVNKTAVSRP